MLFLQILFRPAKTTKHSLKIFQLLAADAMTVCGVFICDEYSQNIR